MNAPTSIFVRDAHADDYDVLVNGKRVNHWIYASVELGEVAIQNFTGWNIGDPLPEEVFKWGIVEIRPKVQTRLDLW